MHVADGEDVNQKTDEGDEERVSSAETIHREREVGVKRTDAQPGPDVIEHGHFSAQRALRIESEIKRDDGRDRDGAAGDRADESFVAHAPADEPIDSGAGERCEDDYAEEIVFHYNFKTLASFTSSVSRLRKIEMMIPKPTAASAAATVITMNTNNCPVTS